VTSFPPRSAFPALRLPRTGPARRREVAILGALIFGIVTAMLFIASIGFETLSATRAYVGAEGLWSKAQKDAVYHLVRYIYEGDTREYSAFVGSLAVYQGDRLARLQLLAPDPDWDEVTRGFLAGRVHPDDVNRMGAFLRRYQPVPFVTRAIQIWSVADSLMIRLEDLGRRLHAERGERALTPERLSATLLEIDALTNELTRVENAFSDTMGGGARWAVRWLLVVLTVIALVLLALAAVTLRAAAKRLRESEEARRAVEAQLRQAQKMEAVGQLTGGIAHDFNNLLTVILSSIQLLEDRLPVDDPLIQADFGELKFAARRGAEMIRKLLAFSRSGQFTFEPQALERVVPEAVQMLRRILPASVRFDIEIDPATPPAEADPAAVQQMVVNLATNACDGMFDQGVLRLRLGPAAMDAAFVERHRWGSVGRYAALQVTDNGTGMPPEVVERIFEPFFTTKGPGEGSGLGMAMVYGLIKQHGGFVDVESTLGVGTTVTLYFPAATTALPVRPVVPSDAPRPVLAPGGTILVVEDEPALRSAAQRLLRRLGYRVMVAADGEEGLQLARDHQGTITLVLSDVIMPKLGGSGMYAALRREGINLPFLFTSGYTGREMPDGIPLPQNVPFLPKPWDAHELAAAVARAIQGAPSSSLRGEI
jgi:signal transduction histidine kinase/ActR/RegA family two-component response regulator